MSNKTAKFSVDEILKQNQETVQLNSYHESNGNMNHLMRNLYSNFIENETRNTTSKFFLIFYFH
jgi:hypothetical protein